MIESGQVYVIDDDAMVRRSTIFSLASAGYAARPFLGGGDFVEELPVLKPGCVMLDVRMPHMDGFQVLAAMHDKVASFPTVVITGHGDVASAVRAMKLGASDFLEKPFEDQALFDILERLFRTLSVQAEGSRDRADAERRLASLSPREVDVLRGLANGLQNKVLAGQLGLSVRTVEMHRANLMDRLGVRSLADALRLAFRAGLGSS